MRSIFTALFVLSVLFVAPQYDADAAGSLTTVYCRVDQAGPNGPAATNGVVVYLTFKSGNSAWPNSKRFRVPAVFQKEFLATALTAMANGKQVRVQLKSGALYSMFLTNIDATDVL